MLNHLGPVGAGRHRRRLKVAVLSSERAPGLLDLFEGDENRGRLYEIVCVVRTTPPEADHELASARGVPTCAHPIREFYRRRGAPIRDMAVRAAYDRETRALLAPYSPDLVLLDGYLYLVTQPLLSAYPARMLNLHFSDLTRRLPDGRPQFPGLRAVRDALLAGQPTTAATVHLVNETPDDGTPVVRSWPFPVSPLVGCARSWSAVEMFKAYVFAHQEWMIRAASGPLLAAALALVAEGSIDLDSLAESNPATIRPWDLDERGRLTGPAVEQELAG